MTLYTMKIKNYSTLFWVRPEYEESELLHRIIFTSVHGKTGYYACVGFSYDVWCMHYASVFKFQRINKLWKYMLRMCFCSLVTYNLPSSQGHTFSIHILPVSVILLLFSIWEWTFSWTKPNQKHNSTNNHSLCGGMGMGMGIELGMMR